jgi:hypothetical protein
MADSTIFKLWNGFIFDDCAFDFENQIIVDESLIIFSKGNVLNNNG